MEFGPSDLALDAAGAQRIFSEAQIEPHPPDGGGGDRAHGGVAGWRVPRRVDRERAKERCR